MPDEGGRSKRPDAGYAADPKHDRDESSFGGPYAAWLDSNFAADSLEAMCADVQAKIRLVAPSGFDWVLSAQAAAQLIELARTFHGALASYKAGESLASRSMLVNGPIFALINASLRLAPADRAVLDALTADIGATATRRGVKLGAPHPASQMIEASTDDRARILATRDAAQLVVDSAAARLAALDDQPGAPRDKAIAEASVRLVPLFDLLTTRGDDLREQDSEGDAFDGINRVIEHLATIGRLHQINMTAGKLDDVFQAQDRMLIRNGRRAARQRAAYYEDRNASQMDRDPSNDDESDSGRELIGQILGGYKDLASNRMAALSTTVAKLEEPPPPRDRSAFERFIVAALQHGVGALSTHLTSGFTAAIAALAKNPGAIAGVAGEAAGTLVDAGSAIKDALPDAAQRGLDLAADAGGRAARRLAPAARAVGDLMTPFSTSPEVLANLAATGRSVFSVLDGDDVLAGIAKDEAKKPATLSDGANSIEKPHVIDFVDRLGAELANYINSVGERIPQLRRVLETLPPDALQRIRVEQDKTLAGAYDAMHTSIAERWSSALAVANLGADSDGTIGEQGSWTTKAQLPGVLQLDATVKVGSGLFGSGTLTIVDADKPTVAKLGASLLVDLQKGAKRVSDAPMQRVLNLRYDDPAKGPTSLGLIEISPEGEIDLSRADVGKLTALAHGEAPADDQSLGRAMNAGRADPAAAARFVRAVLDAYPHTTATTRDAK